MAKQEATGRTAMEKAAVDATPVNEKRNHLHPREWCKPLHHSSGEQRRNLRTPDASEVDEEQAFIYEFRVHEPCDVFQSDRPRTELQ